MLCVCAVRAAAGSSSSPWGSPPEKRRGSGSGSGGQSKGKPAGDSSKKKGSSKGGRDGAKNAAKKPKSSSSGQGFGPKAQVLPPVQTYKITPPLTPQLLVSVGACIALAAGLQQAVLLGVAATNCHRQWMQQECSCTVGAPATSAMCFTGAVPPPPFHAEGRQIALYCDAAADR